MIYMSIWAGVLYMIEPDVNPIDPLDLETN